MEEFPDDFPWVTKDHSVQVLEMAYSQKNRTNPTNRNCIFANKNTMIVKQIYNTGNKKHLLINLPDSFQKKRRVLVVLDDSVDARAEKLELMKTAKTDPLFQSDIEMISNDFCAVDNELL